MSYLVEQPPHCDLLRLSLVIERFVRNRTDISLDGSAKFREIARLAPARRQNQVNDASRERERERARSEEQEQERVRRTVCRGGPSNPSINPDAVERGLAAHPWKHTGEGKVWSSFFIGLPLQ